MEATNLQESMSPDRHPYSEKEMTQDFYERLKLKEEFDDDEEEEEHEDDDDNDEEEEEEDEEEEFSFVLGAAAEEAFSEGEMKTVFPLFDQSLIYSDDLPMRPPVKNVFVETSSSSGNDEIAGPYCDLSSRKAVEASPEVCKKSNSTGFSKIWRLKESTARSNSDGRDAFVFLNGAGARQPAAEKEGGKAVKKSGRSKKAAVSAHEAYLRSKAKEEERRRSYLPYRPEFMGFFTNVNAGLTRNVHPF